MSATSRIRLVAAFTLLAVVGCSSARTFQHRVVPHGGHDAAGADDQLYFELRNVRGLKGGGIGALQLPEDWPSRVAVMEPNGSLRLQPPMAARWTFGADLRPSVSLHYTGEGVPGHQAVVSSADRNPIDIPVLPDAAALTGAVAQASQRVQAGANAYALVLSAESQGVPAEPDAPRHEYRLFGARKAGDEVEWVELMTLTFEDSRSGVARALDVPVRQYPLLDWALIGAALAWPFFLL